MSEIFSPPIDRLKSAIASIIRELLPRVDFLGVYEYTVVADDGTKLDASPTDGSIGLPSITNVVKSPAMTGGTSMLPSGYKVRIHFVNGNPTRPEVCGGDPATKVNAVSIEATISATVTAATSQLKGDILAELSAPLAKVTGLVATQITAPIVTIAEGVQGAARLGDSVGPFVITSGSVRTLVG